MFFFRVCKNLNLIIQSMKAFIYFQCIFSLPHSPDQINTYSIFTFLTAWHFKRLFKCNRWMQTKHWNNLSTSFKNRLPKMRVFSVLFKIACVVFFLNESFSCLQEYLHQETVSVSVLGGQETYGIPRICFAFSGFWDFHSTFCKFIVYP